MPASSEPNTVFQLRISLDEVQPEVWRRLLVPGAFQLSKLHDVFQVAMGWTDSHLHSFTIADELYGSQDDDDFEEELDEKEISLVEALAGEQLFHYSYDFGDDWFHDITVERVGPPETGAEYPRLLSGARSAPPEDVGGIPGYEQFLQAIADPTHDEHERYLTWLGETFDPEAFDLAFRQRLVRKTVKAVPQRR